MLTNEVVQRDTMVRELLQPLLHYLSEPGTTEIVINRPTEVFCEVGAVWTRHEEPTLTWTRLHALARAVATYTEQDIGPEKPILSATLPDGERVQIVVPPVCEIGRISFSIRRPSDTIRTFEQYEQEGAFTRFCWARPDGLKTRVRDLDQTDRELVELLDHKQLAQFIRRAVERKKNIAVVGQTGSGKTTLMKTICQCIPTRERLVTIEDVRELVLPHHPNRVHLMYSKGGQGVAKVTPSDLIASTMRMKPDRVLLAELRGSEAFDFLKLLTTGHSGSITSYHAESCALAAERYVFMCKEHEQAAIYDAPSLKRLVALTIDVILHVVAAIVPGRDGLPRKEWFVSEVHYDPAAKLVAQFGHATLVRA
jgi:type IV secretion system protein VirB11